MVRCDGDGGGGGGGCSHSALVLQHLPGIPGPLTTTRIRATSGYHSSFVKAHPVD